MSFPKFYGALTTWPWLRISPQSSLNVIYCLIILPDKDWWALCIHPVFLCKLNPLSPLRNRLKALLLWETGHLSSRSRSYLGRLILIHGRPGWGGALQVEPSPQSMSPCTSHISSWPAKPFPAPLSKLPHHTMPHHARQTHRRFRARVLNCLRHLWTGLLPGATLRILQECLPSHRHSSLPLSPDVDLWASFGVVVFEFYFKLVISQVSLFAKMCYIGIHINPIK